MQTQETETSHNNEEHEINMNVNINDSYMAPWSFETNWRIAHGSLASSVAVESSDFPITESDQQDSIQTSPLILEPPAPDSGPCEIKICFRQKYDVFQVYVRSTSRLYEIYYANPPKSSNEYLCTVRCGIAERDEMTLQTGIEDTPEEHTDGSIGELTEEITTDGGNVTSSEDEWVKIKSPEDGRNSSSNPTGINEGKNEFSSIKTNDITRRKKVQDLYEATAHISDVDPCTMLTIRLVSLQDKDCLHIDEVYVYADPAESSDAGDLPLQPGSSNGSSLMAMLVPTLLQLSKSGTSQARDTHASGEVKKDNKMETGSTTVDATEIATRKNCNKEVAVGQQNLELQRDDESASDPAIVQPPSTSSLNMKACVEPVEMHDLPQGRLERALEQLISRVSRVEDVCLRFEEKILKPIESMEARLQHVEQQLETLANNSEKCGMPHFRRISAPSFSCSPSYSSSLHEGSNHQPNHQPCVESNLEKKDSSFNNISDLPHDAPNSHTAPHSQPSLVVSAPEFICEEDEEENDDIEPVMDSPHAKPKKSSINAALAAALSGFLSTATIHSPEHGKNQNSQHDESCQMKSQDSLTAESGGEELSHRTQSFTVTAPDFTAKEIADEEHLDNIESPSVLSSECRDEKVCCSEIVPADVHSKNPAAIANSSYFNGNESLPDLGLSSSSASADNGHLDVISEPSTHDNVLKEGAHYSSLGESIESPLDQTEDLATDCDTRQREPNNILLEDKGVILEQDSGDESVNTSEAPLENGRCTKDVVVEGCFKDNLNGVAESNHASLVDFDSPILDVKFNGDDHTSFYSPLEVLLDGAAVSNVEAPLLQETGDVFASAQENHIARDDTDPLGVGTSDHLLVDLGVSSIDGPSNMDDGLHNLCGLSNPEMFVSLI